MHVVCLLYNMQAPDGRDGDKGEKGAVGLAGPNGKEVQ